MAFIDYSKEETTSQADRAKQYAQQGAREAGSALLQPEGLMTAAAAGWALGPAGILVGIGAGILAKRMRQTEADKVAAENKMLGELDAQHAQAIQAAQGVGSTDIDKMQLEQYDKNYMALRKASMSPDPETRQAAILDMARSGEHISAWLEDVETRNETVKDAGVGMLDEQAKYLRDNFTGTLTSAQETQRISSEMHTLLADPTFDVNNPLNRARLGSLLEQTPREMLADAPGFLESIGSTFGVGEFASGITGGDKFKFTKQQWATIAHAMNSSAQSQTRQAMSDAAKGGQMLDAAAAKIGHAPPISYVESIITGKVQGGATPKGGAAYAETAGGDQYESPKPRGPLGNVESDEPSIGSLIGDFEDRMRDPEKRGPRYDVDTRQAIEERLRQKKFGNSRRGTIDRTVNQ